MVIIGAGSRGKMIQFVLQRDGVVIDFWDKDFRKSMGLRPLMQTVPQADFLFLCIPSWEVRNVISLVAASLKTHAVVVALAKGIEETTKKTIDTVLYESLSLEQPFGFLSGPILAEEVNRGLIGIGVFASPDGVRAYQPAAELFLGTNLHLEYSLDMRGIAYLGALKNIYAIGLGIVDGFGWGVNIKGWFVAKAVQEMKDIVEKLGGKKETVLGLAGLGDLMATAFSPYSHNRQVGYDIATTGKYFFRSEGVVALPSVVSLLGLEVARFSFLEALQRVILHNEPAENIFLKFLTPLVGRTL